MARGKNRWKHTAVLTWFNRSSKPFLTSLSKVQQTNFNLLTVPIVFNLIYWLLFMVTCAVFEWQLQSLSKILRSCPIQFVRYRTANWPGEITVGRLRFYIYLSFTNAGSNNNKKLNYNNFDNIDRIIAKDSLRSKLILHCFQSRNSSLLIHAFIMDARSA